MVALALVGSAALTLAGCTTRLVRPEDLPLPYRQAEDAFGLGDYDRAVRGYRIFVEMGEADEYVPRAYYKMALAEFRRERYAECLAVLDELERRFPDYEWSQAYALRGDAEFRRGNAVSAMVWWERAWTTADDQELPKVQRRVEEAVNGMNRATLKRVRDAVSTADIQDLIDERLRRIELGAPEPKAPTKATGTGGRSVAAPPETGPAPRIACLLPLSGSYAIYGRRSLNGIRLALGSEANELVARDTGGDPQNAQAALDQLIADSSIIAVIGPLRSEVAAAIAPRAERAGLPMVALSQRQGITGEYVIQPTMTQERQAAELAEYAVGALRLRRFGIIHPNDAYGSGLADAFRDEIKRRNGQIVGAVGYAPSTSEFSVEVLSMEKWADDGLDAVFLPGYAETSIALATALRQARPELVLLGSNGWNDPQQLGKAGREVDGAVFVDGFFADSQRPATRAFVAAYRAAYATPPDILEAQAYDAATLVMKALAAGARSRPEVISRLKSRGPIEGVAGTIGVGPSGIQRELFLLRLVGGTVQEILPGGEGSVEKASHREPEAPAVDY